MFEPASTSLVVSALKVLRSELERVSEWSVDKFRDCSLDVTIFLAEFSKLSVDFLELAEEFSELFADFPLVSEFVEDSTRCSHDLARSSRDLVRLSMS